MLKDYFFRNELGEIYENIGLSYENTIIVTKISSLVILLVLATLGYFVGKFILRFVLIRIVKRTRNEYDDVFIDAKFLRRVSYIIPLLIIYKLTPIAIPEHSGWIHIILDLASIFLILFVLLAICALLDSFHSTYQRSESAKTRPIKGYLQILKILGGFIAGILILAIIINQSPGYLLTGLGALTAVLLLIFKDIILGFVASVQLSSNDMLRHGDWITMEKYKADGNVLEINLSSVKVKNFDHTIVTIPTYSLISDSFQNWRGMKESEGRRIKRAINIDLDSIRFIENEELETFRNIAILKNYIDKKQNEITEYNNLITESQIHSINQRKQTNIGLFRAYLKEYIKTHPAIQHKLTIMVRQLPAADNGVPLEIYCFTKTKEWVEYEAVVADIFDHVLSATSSFGLIIFQNPAGKDFRGLKENNS